MQTEHETPKGESTEDLFRQLGLEDTEVQDHFRQLAEPSDWHSWRKSDSEPQDTQDFTVEEHG